MGDEVMIASRPAEAEDRMVSGDRDGDLLVGLERSAIGMLFERSSRLIMLVQLPRETGYALTPSTKNGPALAGDGARTIANALKRTVTRLSSQ